MRPEEVLCIPVPGTTARLSPLPSALQDSPSEHIQERAFGQGRAILPECSISLEQTLLECHQGAAACQGAQPGAAPAPSPTLPGQQLLHCLLQGLERGGKGSPDLARASAAPLLTEGTLQKPTNAAAAARHSPGHSPALPSIAAPGRGRWSPGASQGRCLQAGPAPRVNSFYCGFLSEFSTPPVSVNFAFL